jgi:cytochrome c oxidase subunit 2
VRKALVFFLTCLCSTFGVVLADGGPVPWQLNFRPAATPTMEKVVAFHDFLNPIIIFIAFFVIALMAYIIVRFSAKNNPTPSRNTHNTFLEILWTVIPVLILIIIAIPSFKLLYFSHSNPNTEMTIKAIGHQWYWSYEYPDQGIAFDSNMLCGTQEECDEISKETGKKHIRLLDVDEPIVVPVNKKIKVISTADDVIHSFAVPAFGIKIDGVPGRAQDTWFEVLKEGTYYGQCSELCGILHGFMPIKVIAVSESEFDNWVQNKKAAAKKNEEIKKVEIIK